MIAESYHRRNPESYTMRGKIGNAIPRNSLLLVQEEYPAIAGGGGRDPLIIPLRHPAGDTSHILGEDGTSLCVRLLLRINH